MNSIIVGFSHPRNGFQPFSWLIKAIMGAPYSHAYIRFYSESYERWIVYQASGLKVNFIGEKKFDSEEIICGEFEVPISEEAKKATVQWAIDRCGVPYSLKQVLGIGLVLLAKSFGLRIKNPFYDGSSYVCSEMVAFILKDLLTDDDDLDPTTATPKDVYLFLESKGFKKISG